MTDRERNHVPELEHIVQHNEVPLHVIVAPIAGELPWRYDHETQDWVRWQEDVRVGILDFDVDARYAIEGWLAEKVRGPHNGSEQVLYIDNEANGVDEPSHWAIRSEQGWYKGEYPTYLEALVAAYLKMGAE